MKIAVLISGGVDSSVVLALLVSQGYEIDAFYLKIWLEDELSFLGTCPWQEDLGIVESVCKKFNVNLTVVPLQKEYHDRVISYTIEEIKNGRTPNPDMFCNPYIKFGAFYDFIGEKYDFIATGHYADVVKINDKFHLKSVKDSIKDQNYFLARLSQKQLSKAMFPLSSYLKNEIRQLAQEFDLPNKNRKDSQGLCFLGKISFKDFIKAQIGIKIGDFIEFETGKKIGTHEGFWFFTIGQRQGIGLSGGPWYVVQKNVIENVVFISKNYFEDKKRDSFFISDVYWFSGFDSNNKNLKVKLRHGPHFHDCSIEKISEDRFFIKLENNDQGISSGQFAVFYDENLCLGSGKIEN